MPLRTTRAVPDTGVLSVAYTTVMSCRQPSALSPAQRYTHAAANSRTVTFRNYRTTVTYVLTPCPALSLTAPPVRHVVPAAA